MSNPLVMTNAPVTQHQLAPAARLDRLPLPDRLSTDVRSQYHIKVIFDHEIGIRFNDSERTDVEEYCISEGWIKVPVGKKVDRKGFPLTIKLKGRVEAFYK